MVGLGPRPRPVQVPRAPSPVTSVLLTPPGAAQAPRGQMACGQVAWGQVVWGPVAWGQGLTWRRSRGWPSPRTPWCGCRWPASRPSSTPTPTLTLSPIPTPTRTPIPIPTRTCTCTLGSRQASRRPHRPPRDTPSQVNRPTHHTRQNRRTLIWSLMSIALGAGLRMSARFPRHLSSEYCGTPVLPVLIRKCQVFFNT